MNDIKGFFNFSELSNNEFKTIGKFGELSTYSQTFSRSLRNYSATDSYPHVELITFNQSNITTGDIPLNADVENITLALGDWLYTQHINAQIPAQASKASFISSIASEFTDFRSISVGAILSGADANRRMPDYVKFEFTAGGVEHKIQVWCADSSFRGQYPHYEILAIPPVNMIDQLDNPTAQVNLALKEQTAVELVSKINALVQNDPYTRLYSYTLNWHDPDNFESILETTWTLIIYGQAGIDAEAVKNTIRTYITDNSGRDNWNKIYPDLYSENEFILIPMWDKIATTLNNNDQSIYSSLLNIEETINSSIDRMPAIYGQSSGLQSFIDNNLMIMSVYYRNMMVTAIGNPNNKDGISSIKTVFSDYIDIPTSNPDFNRMENFTQNFVIKLNDALGKAREFEDNSAIPDGYTRSIRNNRSYLGFEYGEYNYLVMTRQGFLKE